jgi:hypothetical protein
MLYFVLRWMYLLSIFTNCRIQNFYKVGFKNTFDRLGLCWRTVFVCHVCVTVLYDNSITLHKLALLIGEWEWDKGGMVVTRKTRSTRRKLCPNATLSITTSTWTGLGSKQNLRSESQQVTAWAKVWATICGIYRGNHHRSHKISSGSSRIPNSEHLSETNH